jgi:hypothetical protein
MIALAGAAAAAVGGAGCSMSYLSSREAAGRAQSDYLYSLYDQATPANGASGAGAGTATGAGAAGGTADARGPARALRLPTTVAVVQVGEVAPPQGMVEALRKEPAVFARVETLPGMGLPGVYVKNPASDAAAAHAARHGRYATARPLPPIERPSLSSLRAAAQDAGLEYLLLVGGTIDHDTNGTPLSFLDLTIIGAFVFPGHEARGTAKGSAALIDVRSGRIVASSSAESRDSRLAPAATVENEEVKLMEKLRDEVAAKLGSQVLVDAKNRAALAGGTGGAAAGLGPM